MLTPMRNLGANLLFVFAVGGLWAVGYLVTPFLQDSMAVQDIIVLRKSMMVLAVLGFAINVLTRAKEMNWQAWQDLRSLMGLSALVLGIAFLLVPATAVNLSSALYAVTSLICVAWVGWAPSDEHQGDQR